MSEAFTVNGVSLDSYAYMLTDISGVMTAPVRRGDNVVVPGRHGRIQTRNKRFDAADLVLPLALWGSLADGTVPVGSTAAKEFFKRRDELLNLFYADPLTLAYTRPDGLTVTAVCEVADVLDFTRVAAQPVAKVSIALSLFGAFWRDAATVTTTITGTTGTTQPLTEFLGATAPVQDAVLTFGPCNNPTVTCGNRFVTYNGVISAGRQLVINCANWTVGPGTGTAWTPDPRLVSFGPGPTWFEIDPTVSPFQVSITHTGGGSATCSIAGKRAYLAP